MKHLFSLLLLALAAETATAGGLVTNSNQSASFLRNPARDAVIDIDGVYTNPAGIAFMARGFHLGLTLQHPEQQRNVKTTFAPLALNANHPGEATRTFKGKASAPAVPSLQAAYVWRRWTASASFAFTGGGGKCTFHDGIGSIESVYAMLPIIANKSLAEQNMPYHATGYALESYMKGRQYYYGVQLGATYRINDHLAVFGGLRALIGSAEYTGYVHNVQLMTDAPQPVHQAIMQQVAAQMQQLGDPTGTGAIDLTTSQTCLGWTPVIGIDYRLNEHWNFAAKYEFRTKMNLKNKSKGWNDFARKVSMLDKFNDQKAAHARDDMPGTLTLGAQYSPVKTIRLNAGFHWYDDTRATKYDHEEELIDHGTRELLLGAEWDCTKLITVSAGWQNTHYDLSDQYMQDMQYNCSSNLLGAGLRLHVSKKLSIDLGYMHNIYKDHKVVDNNYKLLGQIPTGQTKTDIYKRKNCVVAVGVNLSL